VAIAGDDIGDLAPAEHRGAAARELAVPKLNAQRLEEVVRMHEKLVGAAEAGQCARINDFNSAWHSRIYDAAASSYLLHLRRAGAVP
jgi:DNA-binding GntR family transcriptional regulator